MTQKERNDEYVAKRDAAKAIMQTALIQCKEMGVAVYFIDFERQFCEIDEDNLSYSVERKPQI